MLRTQWLAMLFILTAGTVSAQSQPPTLPYIESSFSSPTSEDCPVPCDVTNAMYEDDLAISRFEEEEQAVAIVTFRRVGSSGWVETGRFFAADRCPVPGEPTCATGTFGDVMAMSADYLFVSAGSTQFGTAILVYRKVQDIWSYRQTIRMPAGGDVRAISAHGQTVAVSSADGVRVFARMPAGDYRLTAHLTSTEPSFGESLDVSSAIIVVGAPEERGGVGAAYVYRPSSTGWALQQRLAPVLRLQYKFGEAVAAGPNAIAVSAPEISRGKRGHYGRVFIYIPSGSMWTEHQNLVDDRPLSADMFSYRRFGTSLAMHGRKLLIGMHGSHLGESSPLAFLAVQRGDTFQFVAELAAHGTIHNVQLSSSAAAITSVALRWGNYTDAYVLPPSLLR